MTCDHNCFACPYDDCIVEDESPEEAEAAERRDELDRETACKADKDRRRNTKYRNEHPEWYREYMRNYRHTHKDKIKAYKAKWYQKNRDRILAQQKEYRKRKEAAQLAPGTAPDRESTDIVSSAPAFVKGGEK